MSESKQSSQSRFLLAAILSLAVLLGWSYFFAPKKPATDNANTAQNTNTAAAVTPTPAQQTAPVNPQQQQVVASTPDNTPNKSTTIKTPLYQVKLDSRGAVATSWILTKNVSSHGEKILHADGSTKDAPKDLELIPAEGVNKRELPFRLSTGDQSIDAFINDRNYQVAAGNDIVELSGSDIKQIDYVLKDEASGLEVTKSFIFHADNYLTDLQIKVTRNGQVVPNTKLLIGPSIGDQGIEHHNYYHIEPEAVVYTNGGVERHPAASFKFDSNNTSSLPVGTDTDWAGIGDTYFAMAAIPSQKTNGVEFRASKYDVPVTPFYDGIINTVTRTQTAVETRHLLTAYVPISADGSVTKVYTGSKDYFLLSDYDKNLTAAVGRPIEIENFINFSNYSFFRPIFKPIAIIIVRALNFINQFAGNFGLSIIFFTLIFYSMLFPMRWYQSRSFKKAQKNAPKMKELQDRLKELQRKGIPTDDPRMREVQMEQLKMTKDAIPIGGCLPMLLQMPLLIALYTAVSISLDFRQESFLWLPDLSKSDPFYILPFMFSGSMFFSMLVTPTTPTVTPEQQMQQNMMKYLMPLMMLWIGWSVPSGLLVYWIMGNVVSFLQQKLINKINKPDAPPSGTVSSTVEIVNKKPKLSTT